MYFFYTGDKHKIIQPTSLKDPKLEKLKEVRHPLFTQTLFHSISPLSVNWLIYLPPPNPFPPNRLVTLLFTVTAKNIQPRLKHSWRWALRRKLITKPACMCAVKSMNNIWCRGEKGISEILMSIIIKGDERHIRDSWLWGCKTPLDLTSKLSLIGKIQRHMYCTSCKWHGKTH